MPLPPWRLTSSALTPTQPGTEDTNIFTKLYADAMKSKERDAELKKKHDAELAKFSFKPEISPAPCKVRSPLHS